MYWLDERTGTNRLKIANVNPIFFENSRFWCLGIHLKYTKKGENTIYFVNLTWFGLVSTIHIIIELLTENIFAKSSLKVFSLDFHLHSPVSNNYILQKCIRSSYQFLSWCVYKIWTTALCSLSRPPESPEHSCEMQIVNKVDEKFQFQRKNQNQISKFQDLLKSYRFIFVLKSKLKELCNVTGAA